MNKSRPHRELTLTSQLGEVPSPCMDDGLSDALDLSRFNEAQIANLRRVAILLAGAAIRLAEEESQSEFLQPKERKI